MSEVYAARRARLRDRCAAGGSAGRAGLPPRQRPLSRGRAPRRAPSCCSGTDRGPPGVPPAPPDDRPPRAAPTRRCGCTSCPAAGGDPAVAAADLAAAQGADSLAVEEHHLTVARHRAIGSVAPAAAPRRPRRRRRAAAGGQGRGGDLLPADRAPRSPTRRSASCWSRSSSAAPNGTSPWSWSAASSTTAPTAPPSPPPSPPGRTPGRRGHRPTDRRVEEGDFLSVCLGADYRGYRCEIGRTFVIGTVARRLADRAVRPRLRRSAGRAGGARTRRRLP